MAQLTNFAEDLFLNYALNNTAITQPTTLEISFHTQSPTETGSTANEANLFASRLVVTFANSTARVSVNNNTVSDNSLIDATVTYWGIHQQPGGQMLVYQENQASPGGAATPLSVSTGQEVEVAAGDIEIQFPETGTTPDVIFQDGVVNDFLSRLFGSGVAGARNATHIGCHTTGGGEFSGGSYGRAASGWTSPSAGANNRQQCTNDTAVTFSALAASDDPLDLWGVHTAITAGELIALVDQTNQNINDGDGATAGIGALALLIG